MVSLNGKGKFFKDGNYYPSRSAYIKDANKKIAELDIKIKELTLVAADLEAKAAKVAELNKEIGFKESTLDMMRKAIGGLAVPDKPAQEEAIKELAQVEAGVDLSAGEAENADEKQ